MQDKWIGLLHHVCNDHDWPGGSCDHGELPEDHSLPWFDRRAKDFESLQKIILDPALLESFKSYIKFRWTWSLTSHFSLICRAVTNISRCRVRAISCTCSSSAILFAIVAHQLLSLFFEQKVTAQTKFVSTHVKILRRLQNPARFASSRGAVSDDFYWLTSYRCQSWLYMRNIVTQSL